MNLKISSYLHTGKANQTVIFKLTKTKRKNKKHDKGIHKNQRNQMTIDQVYLFFSLICTWNSRELVF
jgi:hypothetical protein